MQMNSQKIKASIELQKNQLKAVNKFIKNPLNDQINYNFHYFHLNSMIWALTFCLLVKLSLTCETRLNNYYDNYFYVTSTSPDCTTFSFIKCQYTYCVQSSTNSDGNSYCDEETTATYTLWDQCLSVLCDMSDKPQTYQTLQECYDANKKAYQLKLGLGIGLGLFFVIGLAVIIFCCYRHNRGCSRWNPSSVCQNCRQCCTKQQESAPQNEVNIQMEKKININEIIPTFQSEVKMKVSQDQICAICLEINVSAILSCNHSYHQKCITDWTTRNDQCPQCRAKIKRVSLICRQCRNIFRNIQFHKNENQIGKTNDLCPDCL